MNLKKLAKWCWNRPAFSHGDRLNDAGAQGQPQRLGYIALAVGKQRGVPLLNLQSRDRLCVFPHRFLSFRFMPTGCLKSARLI